MTDHPEPGPPSLDPTVVVASVLDMLKSVPPADWWDGPDTDLGVRFALLGTLAHLADDIREKLEDDLLDRIGGDELHLPTGHMLRREKKKASVSWDYDAMRRNLRSKIVAKIALDRSTGELNPQVRGIAEEVFEWVTSVWTLPAPLTGRGAAVYRLGFDPDEYRATGAERFALKVFDGVAEGEPS